MDNLFKNIPQKAIYGLHVVFTENECFVYSCALERRNKKLKILSQAKAKVDQSFNLSQVCPEKFPVLLFISSPEIIYKSNLSPFEEVFPNIKHDNFISQSFAAKGENIHAVMRKDSFTTMIDKIGISKEKILKLSIVPNFMEPSLPFIQNLTGRKELFVDRFKFLLNPHRDINSLSLQSEISNVDEEYQVGDEIIHQDFLFAFSLAFAFLVNQNETEGAKGLDVTNSYSYWGAVQVERYILKIGIPVLLLAALLVALFYSISYNENLELKNRVAFYQKSFNDFNQLKRSYEEKKSMISELGWTKNEKLSKIINLITESQPRQIELTQLILNPYSPEKYRKESVFLFDKKVVSIKGMVDEASNFSAWVQRLAKAPWVKEIISQRYFYDEHRKRGKFNLKLEIAIE